MGKEVFLNSNYQIEVGPLASESPERRVDNLRDFVLEKFIPSDPNNIEVVIGKTTKESSPTVTVETLRGRELFSADNVVVFHNQRIDSAIVVTYQNSKPHITWRTQVVKVTSAH